MNILNRSGIEKIVTYLGEDRCKYVKMNGKHLLMGMFTDNEKAALEGIGVTLNHIGSYLHEAALDSTEIETERDIVEPREPINSSDQPSDTELRQLATALMPYLAKAFPTKNEINDVLADLVNQSIDPEEMIASLKNQIKSIKKQSRPNDEAGTY